MKDTGDPYWRTFLSNVRASVCRPDECWPWAGHIDENGYPTVTRCGKPTTTAHRAVWELLVGPIPDGLELDHLCVNPPCVNPHHMEPVTQRENNLHSQSPSARAARATTCRRGHPWDVDNTGWRRNAKTGEPNRVCRACARERQRGYAINTGDSALTASASSA